MYEGFMAAGVAAGGQLTTTTDVENYPGFPKGISGPELMELMRDQSVHHGTTIHTETVTSVDLSQRPFRVIVSDGIDVYAHSLIIATGATAKTLSDKELKDSSVYWQRGISACAVCDGAAPVFRGKPVAVLGGGDSAIEEALFLTRYASRVHLLVRNPEKKLRASKVMQERLLANPKVKIEWCSMPIEVRGDGKLMNALVLKDTSHNHISSDDTNTRVLSVSGLFYAIGHVPNTAFLKLDSGEPQLDLDPSGYIKTIPGTSYTTVEGVFAAGDVQDKRYRQAVTAAGSGCMAALDCERWLESNGFSF